LELVGLLAPSHLTTDSHVTREQLPKDLSRLRWVTLGERDQASEIAVQFSLHMSLGYKILERLEATGD